MIEVDLDISEWEAEIDRLTRLVTEAVPRFFLEKLPAIQFIIQSNNGRIWDSQGGNIGGNWEGNTLVDTGALRESMERVEIEVMGGSLRWSSDLTHAPYVAESFEIYGVDEQALEEIQEEFQEWFTSKVEND